MDRVMTIKRYIGLVTSIFLWGLYAILLMARTRFIIYGFGSEINSIDQSAQQIFNYFILFESGMGAAYLYKMYVPMSTENQSKITALYYGLSISMRRIAVRMILALLPVAIIYAALIDREATSYFTAFLIILLLGLRFVIPYFVSVNKKTLLTLYEYKYLVNIVDSIGNISIVVIELVLILSTNLSIVIVLCTGCLINILLGYVYKFLVTKLCGYSYDAAIEPCFEAEYMTKDILAHKFSGLVDSNTDIFLLSLVNYQTVTIYQIYKTIEMYPVHLMYIINETFRASFGIRLAVDDKQVFRDFQRLLTFHMFVSVITIAVFITNINPLVTLWLGKDFLLGKLGIYLFSVSMLASMLDNVVHIVRDGKGLYKESKGYTARAAVMNLFLSAVLVQWFEIEGVLLASVISVCLNVVPGNSKLVFRNIFHRNHGMAGDYAITILAVGISVAMYMLFMDDFVVRNWGQLFISVCVQGLIATITAAMILGACKFKYIKTGDEK